MISQRVDDLQINVGDEFYVTDLASYYERTFTPSGSDYIPITRGSSPRYITLTDLANGLAIVGPQGPTGAEGRWRSRYKWCRFNL